MKKIAKTVLFLAVLMMGSVSFTSCTDLSDDYENFEKRSLIDPDDDGTFDEDEEECGCEQDPI